MPKNSWSNHRYWSSIVLSSWYDRLTPKSTYLLVADVHVFVSILILKRSSTSLFTPSFGCRHKARIVVGCWNKGKKKFGAGVGDSLR